MTSRRDFLKTGALGAAAGGLTLAGPGLSFAAAPTDRRLVVVILRGGLDGLSVAPPYGDPDLRALRPRILPPAPGESGGALPLAGDFALHPGLEKIHTLFKQGELAVIQAVGNGGRSRSHFDAQDMLENGTASAKGARDGWLNRALAELEGAARTRAGTGTKLGLSVGGNVPLVMRGETRIRTWSPNGLPPADPSFLGRLETLYRADPMFARAFSEARASAAVAARTMGRRQRGRGLRQFPYLAGAAGKLLALGDGPRVATLELGGWDTHVNQKGVLNRRLPRLAEGLVNLQSELGAAWGKTVVVLASEFGRTARENGTRGTDHGTAGAVLLLGGAVAGGRVLGRWPGLAADRLYQGRDLMPTSDIRAVFKGVLRDHLGVDAGALATQVFPDSGAVAPMPGLVRRG